MIPKRGFVFLQEVGIRDGLQNEPRSLAPETRAELIDALVHAGLSRIQIGSFVNPRRVPQMLGTHLVWRHINRRPEVTFTVLVLNEKGLDQAMAEKIPHVEVYVSASQTHSIKNTGIPREKALANAVEIIDKALSHGIGVTAGVMCAFGCFYEGSVSTQRVLRIVEQFETLRPTEICLADSTGMGQPLQVKEMVELLQPITGLDRIGIHLHDTHGYGFANLKAALEAGVRKFDTSVGGLGGCPFIPGAEGNISTERTVEILESMGFKTGINLKQITDIRNRLEGLLGKNLSAGRIEAQGNGFDG
ncbi:MAG: hydroxymethylglutaryl-CoA lyase [Desulfomonile sp.]|jgi:hydroxymethylglutaryl-CoA lyase|nr:hydroxymethylglutaryl-CoA lyase [Deltaproteobacteria bacterium]